ncbi:MAG: hypothetical protein ACOC89_02750 [Candidatus Saliniplasma sp.]
MDIETKFFFKVLEGEQSFGKFDEVTEQIEAVIMEAVIDTLNEKYDIDITVKDLEEFSEVYKKNLDKRLEKYFGD